MTLTPARSELILGGQKSGKSRRAEALAAAWLAQCPTHQARLIATAEAHDAELRARIARHQRERAERVPGLVTREEPRDVAGALAAESRADTLVVVDCLTLWLTHWMFPFEDPKMPPRYALEAQIAHFLIALEAAPGPVVLVGNEIGLGVIPMGREVRAFVDALGTLHQRTAALCQRVTLMVAGLPLTVKEALQ